MNGTPGRHDGPKAKGRPCRHWTGRAIASLTMLVGIGVMLYAGIRLWEAEQVYREGEGAYALLRSQAVKSSAPAPAPTAPGGQMLDVAQTAAPQVDIPAQQIDFAALREVNADVAAWLYCPETVIDYPVVVASDYDYYLHHLPDGRYNANGTLFIDYNCSADFSDSLTVIYGHHMKSGQMFGSLGGYKRQAYYERYPLMYLYTEQGKYRIELLYGCVIGAGQWRERAFMYEENLPSLMAYAQHNTTFDSAAEYVQGERVVALSTCSYEFDDARYIVLGVLRAEFGQAGRE